MQRGQCPIYNGTVFILRVQRSVCLNLSETASISVKPVVRCAQFELNTADLILVSLEITEYFTLKNGFKNLKRY